MKIMLFDESPERSLFLRMTLERLGHDIVAEISEEEAFGLLRKLAMDRSTPLGTVAEQVITFAKLLG